MAVFLALTTWLASPANASRTHVLALQCQVSLTLLRSSPAEVIGDGRLSNLVTEAQGTLSSLEDRIWVLEIAFELGRLETSRIDRSTARNFTTKGVSLIHAYLQTAEVGSRAKSADFDLSRFKQKALWQLREAISDAEDAIDFEWPNISYSPPKTRSTD